MSIALKNKSFGSRDELDFVESKYQHVIEYEQRRRDLSSHEEESVFANRVRSKSSLYARIQAGLPIFRYPPPLSFNYPWYGVIEESKVHQLAYVEVVLEESKAIINQDEWVVLDENSDGSFVVSYSNWIDIDFQWILKENLIPAEEADSFILPHHDPSLKRISTVSELKDLASYHVTIWIDGIKSAANSSSKQGSQKKGYEGYMASIYEKELADRRSSGLSDLPGPMEIFDKKKKITERLLGQHWVIDDKGKLLKKCWTLKRNYPVYLNANIYLYDI